MFWFNYYGLIFLVIIMIPNVVFAIKSKGSFPNSYRNKAVEILEQAGRYGCFVFSIFNLPRTYIGFYFPYAECVYLIINGALVLSYCLIWLVLWRKNGMVKALLLSAIPSVFFLFSGIMIASIPLIAFSIVFSIAHIFISIKNAI